ncbi:MAG: hypothetical protein V1809_08980 [Planctomycetota bacterium]
MAEKIRLAFTHPRGSGSREIDVSPDCTALKAKEGLKTLGFLADSLEKYALTHQATGKQMLDRDNFGQVGAKSGDVISVTEVASGA